MVPFRWNRWITTAAVMLLALIAAVVSYFHMFDLALRHGEPEWRAALFPLSVDGMVVAASMTLLADACQGRRGGVLPWSLLILGSLASLAANIAVADPTVWSRIIRGGQRAQEAHRLGWDVDGAKSDRWRILDGASGNVER